MSAYGRTCLLMILLHNRTRKLWQHYRLYDLYPNMLCIIFYYILYFLVAVFYVKKIMFLAPKNIFHPLTLRLSLLLYF